jgi:alkylation response protein AidB-like acyl-CoA dehydrogenase
VDIALTPEQRRYRDGVRAWLKDNLPAGWANGMPAGRPSEDVERDLLIAWERRVHAAGYSGIAWPKEYGGQGLTMVEHYLASVEFGRVAAPESVNTIGRELVGPILLAVGTEEQKCRFIPRILGVEDVWCQGFSEPNAGSDLASLKTRAVRDGNDWVIDGQKIWTSYAHFANYCILLARTGAAQAKPHKAITLFIVEMDRPGVDIRPIRHMNGLRHFNEVFFTGVRVPDHMRIGPVDGGWSVAVSVLGFERATTRLYRQARYVNELQALAGIAQRNGASDATRGRLGGIAAELEILRYHNLQFVSRIAAGEPIGDEASLLKLSWSQAHQELAGAALDILGPALDENGDDAERFRQIYLTARGETIYAGSSQIQKNIIAERVLGLPRS